MMKTYDYLNDHFEAPADYVEPNELNIQCFEYPNMNCYDYAINVQYQTPEDLLRFYTSLDVNDDGMFILASNNYNTEVYDSVFGASHNFDNIVNSRYDQLEVKQSFQSNILAAKFLSNDKFFIANYSIFTIHSQGRTTTGDIKLFKLAETHINGGIKSIGMGYGSADIIIGTETGDLEVLKYNNDLERCSRLWRAHDEEVTGISAHPSKEKCWVTSSSDKSCVLWDKSSIPPASFLLKDHESRLTDVKWINENLIVASDSSGHLITIDPRNPNVVINEQKVSERVINALTFSKSMKKFGVISAWPDLPIYQIKDDGGFELIHKHSTHPLLPYAMAFDRKDESILYVVGDNKYAKKIIIEA